MISVVIATVLNDQGGAKKVDKVISAAINNISATCDKINEQQQQQQHPSGVSAAAANSSKYVLSLLSSLSLLVCLPDLFFK